MESTSKSRDMFFWHSKAKELMKIQIQRKELEELENSLKEELKQLSQNKSCSYGGLAFLKRDRQGLIDYSKIPELKDINLEYYRKEPTEFWVLQLYLEE